MELKKLRSREFAVSFVIIAFSTILIFFSGTETSLEKDLLTSGYVEASIDEILISNRSAAVILGTNSESLPIYVSIEQALAIRSGAVGEEGVRPDTHDLLKKIINKEAIRVLGLSIDKLEDNIYYGTLYLKRGNEILEIDTRPSDGMAVVSRANKSIFIKEELLHKDEVPAESPKISV